MGDRSEKRKVERTPGGEPGEARPSSRKTRGPEASEALDLDDPREEDGWGQPESSAQKGPEPWGT